MNETRRPVDRRSPRRSRRAQRCQTYIVFGATAGFAPEIPLADLLAANGGDGSQGFVITSIDSSDESGIRVGAAGDLNGDGHDDILIAAPEGSYADDAEGEVYVIFGSDAPFAAELELASLLPLNGGDGRRGFLILGADPEDLAGYSISAAGDVNGDGIDDLLVCAVLGDPGGRADAGEAYVVFGRTTGFPARFHLRELQPQHGGDGNEGFVLNGVAPQEETGRTVSWLGDVNVDGIDDVMTERGARVLRDGCGLDKSMCYSGGHRPFPRPLGSHACCPGTVAAAARASSRPASRRTILPALQ